MKIHPILNENDFQALGFNELDLGLHVKYSNLEYSIQETISSVSLVPCPQLTALFSISFSTYLGQSS